MKPANKLILTLLIAGNTITTSLGQFTDDFSSEILNSEWHGSNLSGSGIDFIVSDGELQSYGPAASSTIWVSREHPLALNGMTTTWTIYVRYGSAPSGSNRVEIFLASTRQDLASGSEGYYIRLGESGSDDGIDLYKTGSTAPIIEDPNPSIADGINATIKVTRDGLGNWLLEADPNGGTDFTRIGSGFDEEFNQGQFFGFNVKHSSTRNQSYYFDNVAILQQDSSPPEVEQVKIISNEEITISFNEPLELASAQNPDHYYINNDIGPPESVWVNEDQHEVTLLLASPLINGTTYTIKAIEIEDLHGNRLPVDSLDFFYFKEVSAKKKDVIINEILADPDPPNDLPQHEYIELYNNSENIYNLKGWTFSDQNTTASFSTFYLRPHEYIIVCQKEYSNSFENYGQVIGLDPWPTLNNSSDRLKIVDPSGKAIDSVAYQQSWYNSSMKSEGGWSLELIDATNYCSGQNNWAASENMSGGTPGALNSVRSEQPDLQGPQLQQILAFYPDSVLLTFNEALDPLSLIHTTFLFYPENEVVNTEIDPTLTTVCLTLSGHLQPGIEYVLSISGLNDCSGNKIQKTNSTKFYTIEEADSSDLIINEILFNPRTGGVDFVEIYNRSQKYINLRELNLANGEVGEPDAQQIKSITEKNYLLAPDQYVAITTDDIILQEQYPFSSGKNFIVSPSMPSYPDAEGTVILLQPDSTQMDRFDYSEKYHFALIKDPEGISLERIQADEPSHNTYNWKSAASTAGFATPGYINSQSMEVKHQGGMITINPQVIIPDGSGYESFATISYTFPQSGFVANVRIMDAYGREVRVLGENEYLPSEGFFTWDGTDDQGRRARIGYYLVFFEVFNLDGDVMRYKEKVVVGTRW